MGSVSLADAFGRLRTGTFRSLQTHNYRLYFFARIVANSGAWIQLIAENWLVIRLGGSGVALGITTALQFAPLLLSPYGGALVDRWNRRTLLVVTQAAAGFLALALGLLALTDVMRIWMVWAAALLLGCIKAVNNPCQEAFTAELVGPANVANAVALNNAVGTSARAIGPAIGGLLIAAAGVAPCFLINAASYGVVLGALRAIDPARLFPEAAGPDAGSRVRDGLQYARRHPVVRTVLLILAVAGIFGTNFQVLLALLTSHTFHGSAALYGVLLSSLGGGMTLGSLAAASWSDPTVFRVGAFSLFLGVAHAAVAIAPNEGLAFAAVAVMGASAGLFLTTCAGCLQLHAGAGIRGRVMALYYIAFLGMAPIGGPLAGWIAERFYPSAGFLLGALACSVASGPVLLRRLRATHAD